MNVVDSSGWLEYFAAGANADFFADAIRDTNQLVVPTLSIYEVFKRVLGLRGKDDALQVTAQMQQGKIVDLDTQLALEAARLSTEYKLPMADSIILATARAYDAKLWTQDADFKGLPNVMYTGKP